MRRNSVYSCGRLLHFDSGSKQPHDPIYCAALEDQELEGLVLEWRQHALGERLAGQGMNAEGRVFGDARADVQAQEVVGSVAVPLGAGAERACPDVVVKCTGLPLSARAIFTKRSFWSRRLVTSS